ncbi:gamma-glutamyltransferase [Brevibacterium senegalense]|uniref:gamma-glutamyltransferase n=1 Tax=Brevibacterium senegalense TaxID=1033736 RepID=UPI001FE03BE7|nr:gamma-glutamyltransferase [Brevibacterium senegalense]
MGRADQHRVPGGKQVYQLPPATQGIAALQILNLLEGFDFSRIPEGGADYHHVIVEAVKLAFADRDEWLSDPAFVDIPLEKLLAQDYADERRQLIDRAVAMDGTAVESGVRRGDEAERTAPTGDTVYFAAADADGLMVSIIQSPHHDFRSGIIAGETGVIPQNRGSFFSLDGTHPHALEPGEKTFHRVRCVGRAASRTATDRSGRPRRMAVRLRWPGRQPAWVDVSAGFNRRIKCHDKPIVAMITMCDYAHAHGEGEARRDPRVDRAGDPQRSPGRGRSPADRA